MIPYGRQEILQEDIDAVVEVLQSDFITQGPAIPKFEKTIANYCKVGYSVGVSNGTSALHLACLALNVGPCDRVWTSPISFVASANCALYCGAEIDFVDIDDRSYNLSVDRLSEKLMKAEKEGRLPKVVIPVHLSGQSCEMEDIHKLGKRYGFKIIEDASHAIGGKYRNKPIGSSSFSDITVFSFHPVKIITTGEGGMALTNDKELAMSMVRLRNHGITRESSQMSQSPDGPWYYEQIELGFNYRMTDIQAALGNSQIMRIDQYVGRRSELAQRYNGLLSKLPVVTPWQHMDSHSSWHLYIIRLDLAKIKLGHLQIFKALREHGIGVNMHYIPIHTQPYYRDLGFKRGDYPEAEQYYAEAISLPIFPGLTETQQDYVVETLSNVVQM